MNPPWMTLSLALTLAWLPAAAAQQTAPAQLPGKENAAPAQASSTGTPAALPESLPGGSQLPSEVVIKGSDSGHKIQGAKPPLAIDSDPFESIRDSLQTDEALLLAESPLTVSWRRRQPEFLSNLRVIQPWRTTFSERPGLVFRIRDQLAEALQRPLEPKQTAAYRWSLTIADEEGRLFQSYEDKKDPPDELIWTGQNDQGEWIKAGRSYSAVYTFTDPEGTRYTRVGKPILFTGIMHQEGDGLHVSLDSSVLFGPSKGSRDLLGEELLRSAADLVKRRYTGIPLRVSSYASTRELAEAQASATQAYLLKELMLLQQNIGSEGFQASFSDQRVEIILLNR